MEKQKFLVKCDQKNGIAKMMCWIILYHFPANIKIH